MYETFYTTWYDHLNINSENINQFFYSRENMIGILNVAIANNNSKVICLILDYLGVPSVNLNTKERISYCMLLDNFH